VRDLKNYGGLAPIHVAALKIIEKRGWHVLSVFPLENSTNQEWFSYSTGLLLTYNHPEIILCGLSSETAHGVINDIGDAVASGRKYELDKDYSDFFAADAKCRFRMSAGIRSMSLRRNGITETTLFQCGDASGRTTTVIIHGILPVILKWSSHSLNYTNLHSRFIESMCGRCCMC
jgi:uncharacterized protein DUF4262